jgi:hypothetical protein
MLNISQSVKFFSKGYFHVAKCSKNCENLKESAGALAFAGGIFRALARQPELD